MSLLLSALLLHAVSATPAVKASQAAEPRKYCREMLISSSRLGAVKVCKTKAAWQRWERCHSATRYCPPPAQQTVTVAALPGDQLICKYLKTTGSRIAQEKICATKRQWELAELEAQEAMRDRQNRSKWVSDSEITTPGGGGPR
jgi:hypothetical protein